MVGNNFHVHCTLHCNYFAKIENISQPQLFKLGWKHFQTLVLPETIIFSVSFIWILSCVRHSPGCLSLLKHISSFFSIFEFFRSLLSQQRTRTQVYIWAPIISGKRTTLSTQICYFSKHWVYFAFCHIKYTVYNFSKHFRDFLTTLAAQSPAQLTVRLRREYPGWTAHLNKWAHVRTSWSLSLPVLTPGCEDCSWSEARAG